MGEIATELEIVSMMRTGSCLCGDVTFEAETMPTMQACHCSMCRKWGGGPFMAVPCQAASFAGPISRYASSEGAQRAFCTTCGTNLYYHTVGGPIHAIPIGLFDDQSELAFRAEIYFDDKPDYYAFANPTKKMTGAGFEERFKTSQ
jgi:hypothetical protein